MFKQAPPPLPMVPYKPSADCKYSQLVNRIQGTQSESLTPPPPYPPPDLTQTTMTYEQQQYYQQYYYVAQYYEYYKQVAQQFQGQNSEISHDNKISLEGDTFNQNQIYGTSLSIQNPAAYAHYLQQSTNNPYAQIVSNLSQNKDAAPLPSQIYPPDCNPTTTDIAKAPIIYNQNEPEPISEKKPEVVTAVSAVPIESEIIKKPLLSLAQYGSDSDNENASDNDSDIKIPPTETEQIINKMASYVIKNGKDFENIVRSKGDLRFEFLNENHQYHPYYRLKVKEYMNEVQKTDNETVENGVPKSKEKKTLTPVSFSIKKPKDEMPKEIKSALPIEESDEDVEEACGTPSETSASNTPTSTPVPNHTTSLTPPPRAEPSTVQAEETNESESKILEAEDLILEMIDLTDDLEERRENKRVEDRKKRQNSGSCTREVSVTT